MKKLVVAIAMTILLTGSVINTKPVFAEGSINEPPKDAMVQEGQTVEELQKTIDALLAQIAELQGQLKCQERHKRLYELNPKAVEKYCRAYVRAFKR